MVTIVLTKCLCYRPNIFSFTQLLSISHTIFLFSFFSSLSHSIFLTPAQNILKSKMNDLYLIKMYENSYLLFINTQYQYPISTYASAIYSQRLNTIKYIFRVYKNNGIVCNLHEKNKIEYTIYKFHFICRARVQIQIQEI